MSEELNKKEENSKKKWGVPTLKKLSKQKTNAKSTYNSIESIPYAPTGPS